jgi:alpha-L-rhamnosidase
MQDIASVRSPIQLRCEYLMNPLGVDAVAPRLSWLVNDPRQGARQTAYQIVTAASEAELESAPLWDSSKVESDQSVHVDYKGPALASRQRVFWHVRTWDADGKPSPWSEPAFWEMGLLRRDEWKGKWIGSALVGGKEASVPCPMLRKEFSLEKGIVSARLYVTSLGLNDCRINGRQVSDAVFSPGWTHYGKRVQYEVFDVTSLIRPGANALGVVLGDGWYCGHVAWQGRQNYGDRPKLLAQLELRDQHGNLQIIATDETWRWSTGPWIESDILMGESYDARLEQSGWDDAPFDDGTWFSALTFEDPGIAIVPRLNPPVRRIQEIVPIGDPVKTGVYHDKGRWVYDLGQNFAGRIRLRIEAPAGRTVRIRHAEMLQADGTLYTENLRSARATDYYTCKGGGPEIYEPLFTFHGFRYVEVTGIEAQPGVFAQTADVRPAREVVTGVVLHSDTPETGMFECSNPLVNQLQSNIRWGQKSNFLEVPTDCPQRNERLGWTGDAQVFVRTAAFNMEVARFFSKWQRDLADEQGPRGEFPMFAPKATDAGAVDGGPAWADAGLICAWTMYLCYGDTRLLEEHYDSFAKFIAYLESSSVGLVRSHEEAKGFPGFGDWLAIDAVSAGEAPTPRPLIGTAYFAYCTRIMTRISGVLGKTEEARRYRELDEKVRAVFAKEFVTPSGRVVGSTQTGYLLALGFDLLPEEARNVAVNLLVNEIKRRGWHLSTGFVGTPLLCPVLTRFGRHDVAYRLLLQETYPGWLYSIHQGATTMWERWNSYTKDKGFGPVDMNSFNHYAYGAIGEWLYAKVGGIDLDPARPGYKHIIISPQPGGDLTHASATLHSPYGMIETAWKLDRTGAFVLKVTIPANTTATVHLPDGSAKEVAAGQYDFACRV